MLTMPAVELPLYTHTTTIVALSSVLETFADDVGWSGGRLGKKVESYTQHIYDDDGMQLR